MRRRSTAHRSRLSPRLNAQVIGDQEGDVVLVHVLNKAQADGQDWLQIELLRPLRATKDGKDVVLSGGTKCWLEKGGLDIVIAPWLVFRNHLIEFEDKNRDISLTDRITKLRQMTHEKNLPFDAVIGTGKGSLYLDTLSFVPNVWQLAKDYQGVRTPDGRVVDIQHLMVGLDVLRRSEEARSFEKIPIGTNWAASTWSGDIGAGAADMLLSVDQNWERRNPKASFAERADHYFQSRASEWDLLADVDVWALNIMRENDSTIDSRIARYYEDTTQGGARVLTKNRANALGMFLRHYGFTYDYERDKDNYPVLARQSRGVGRVDAEISLFAQVWMLRRKIFTKRKPAPENIAAMRTLFLYWLEYNALENGVQLDGSGRP